MSTAQLVVIWYATIAISGILFFQDHSYNPFYSVAAVAIVAATILYTLRKHDNARKGLVLFWVVSPFIVTILVVVGWLKYDEYKDWQKSQMIKHQEVTLSNVHLNWGERKSSTWIKGKPCKIEFHEELLRQPANRNEQRPAVMGCLQNKSQTFHLHRVDIEITFDGGDETVTEIVHISTEVPPGETREFYGELKPHFAYMFPIQGMSYKVLETRARSAGNR